MRTSKKYTRELYRQFRYYASWLPGTPLSLGDIGILQGKEFVKKTNLNNLNLDFEILEDSTPSQISHYSKGGVSISAKIAGTAPVLGSILSEAEAGISVSFNSENSVLFKANGTYNHTIKDQAKLAESILSLYAKGKWDKDYLVITELVEADSSTIIISNSKDAKIELTANANVNLGQLDIANADIGLSPKISKDLYTEIVANKGLTPLFKLSKVQTKIFQEPIFEATKMRGMKNEQLNTGINREFDYFGEYNDIE